MPINEREYHPYIFEQVNDFNNAEDLIQYKKLIVGTFPIYALTDSDPIENLGFQKKNNWQNEANIRYFYGSNKNHFWRLFSNAFDEELPNNAQDAMNLLNRRGFLITDTFIGAFRNGYSPLDQDIIDPIPNHNIFELLGNCINLRVIYFTSYNAKQAFCNILNVPCPVDKDSIVNISNKNYRLIELITPASNARSAWSYRHSFPLLQEEMDNRANGDGYALAYRQRYYSYYLSIPYTQNN